MKRGLLIFLACLPLWLTAAVADDVDGFLPGGAMGGVFIQVVMDLGNTELDSAVCTFGVDCAPPFMTEAAHRHLGDMYVAGAAVTAPGVFKAVLAAVLENALFDDFQVALLISNHQDNRSADIGTAMGGGTILQGYRRLQEHRSEFVNTLKSTPVLASTEAHELQPKESYFEWLRYIQGGTVLLGENTRGNFGRAMPVPNYDASVIKNGRYLTPFIDQQGCQRLYSILFTQGLSTHDEDLNAQIAAQLPLPSQSTFTQLLTYLHRSTQVAPYAGASVSLQKTWVVTSRDRPGPAAEYAVAGGGADLLYVNEPAALQASLTNALAALTSGSGSSLEVAFAADSFNPGQVLDRVYVPFFLPRVTTSGPGNLKKLKLKAAQGSDGTTAGNGVFDQVVDARGKTAFEKDGENKGRLRFEALTYWTDVTTLPPGDGDTIPDGADGHIVTRGGAGQKIDGFVNYAADAGKVVEHFIGDTNADAPVNGYPPRQLFYEPGAGQLFAPLDANAKTLLQLALTLDPTTDLTDEALLDLLKWARGQDIDSGDSTARGWIMGEVMHSRPVALNYGATPGYSRVNPNVRLLFGSGEGMFHILQDTDATGNESGREVFGFYPRELLANIRWQHEGTRTSLPRHYGVDGAPAVLRVDKNGDGTLDYRVGDEAYVYVGLRRGGSSYFALDISNPAAVPGLLWKISPDAGGAFTELGLTFSTPVVGKVNYSGVPQDVLIFAGGYDGGWNQGFTARRGKDLGAEDDTVGNAIFIVNARTGELVWKAYRGVTGVSSNTRYAHAGLVDSIPSTVAALITPAGIMHRLYVGDTGGAVWRIDLPESTGGDDNHRKDHWFITKLADLGSDAAETGGSARDDRRFFHAPDTVHSKDAFGDFDGVLIQSGNREDPNETVVENAFFYLKDREVTTGSAVVQAENSARNPAGRYQYGDLTDQATCISGAESVGAGADGTSCGDRSLKNGWRVPFLQPGEKGVSTPLTDGGRVFAATFVPGKATACSAPQGRGLLHVLQLANATAVANTQRYYELGPGIPATVLSVGETIFLPGAGIDLYDLDGDGERDSAKLLPSQAGKLYRTYWREPDVDPL